MLANPTARRLFRWEARNLEASEVLDELPERLAMELGSALQNLISGQKESSDVRSSFAISAVQNPHPGRQ